MEDTGEIWVKSHEAGIIVRRQSSFPFLNFKAELKVLDIGCGMGYDLKYLIERFGINAYGCDLIVPKGLRKICFVRADASHLPFTENCFDVAYSFGSIEHSKKTLESVVESFRVTKSGGVALHTVPNVFSLHSLLARPLLKASGKWRIGIEQSFTFTSFHKIFSRSGFTLIQYKILPFDTEVKSKQFSSLSWFVKFFKLLDNSLAKMNPFWGHFIAMSGTKTLDSPAYERQGFLKK